MTLSLFMKIPYAMGINKADRLFNDYCEALNSGISPKLTLAEYICCAARYQVCEDRDNDDGWNSKLWHFTRSMKGHPDIWDLTADEAFDSILSAIAGWKGPNSIWLGRLDLYDEEVELEFVSTWDKVRYRPGLTPLGNATASAELHPLAPKRCRKRQNSLYARFVSIAGWLQVARGDQYILLPVDSLSGILGCHRTHVSWLRQLAEKDGYLTKVKDHTHRPGRAGEATEFRFDTSRFEILSEKSPK